MGKEKSHKDKPFHLITTTTRTFVDGFDTQEQAKAAKERANNEATAMGLETRYKVKKAKS